MTWIRVIPKEEADEPLRAAMAAVQELYPIEYSPPGEPTAGGESIVASHSLIPAALRHAFSTFGALMAPELPLQRRHHEMIATRVSALNRCHY
jgi:alkylhydroperoxidase family enzyme